MKSALSFDMAHSNLDNIMHGICEKAWEKEVIEKKGAKHSVNWIFQQAEVVQQAKRDPNLVTTEFDQDGHDEPVSVNGTSPPKELQITANYSVFSGHAKSGSVHERNRQAQNKVPYETDYITRRRLE